MSLTRRLFLLLGAALGQLLRGERRYEERRTTARKKVRLPLPFLPLRYLLLFLRLGRPFSF